MKILINFIFSLTFLASWAATSLAASNVASPAQPNLKVANYTKLSLQPVNERKEKDNFGNWVSALAHEKPKGENFGKIVSEKAKEKHAEEKPAPKPLPKPVPEPEPIPPVIPIDPTPEPRPLPIYPPCGPVPDPKPWPIEKEPMLTIQVMCPVVLDQ